MILLLLSLVVLKCFEVLQLYQLRMALGAKKQEPVTKKPPKARESFVVKRMEERLKEALYE